MIDRRQFLKRSLQCIGLVGVVSLAPSYALAKVAPPEVIINMGPHSMISNSRLENCRINMGSNRTLTQSSFMVNDPNFKGPLINVI